MAAPNVKPILKWAGGKRSIMNHIIKHFPDHFENYHEPFAGGLSVFLHLHNTGLLENKDVFLSDSMMPLINLYDVIKHDVERLHRELEDSPDYINTAEHFAANRETFNATKHETGITQAALFVYLNKTCFNGMYRENLCGKYNVPYGNLKNPRIYGASMLYDLSTAFSNVSLDCCDYTTAIGKASKGDLVYMDPPYHGTFTAYTKDRFDESDQQRLKYYVDELTHRGVYVVLSNSDTPFIRELYKDYAIHEIPVKRSITCKASDRKKTFTELVVTNINYLS